MVRLHPDGTLVSKVDQNTHATSPEESVDPSISPAGARLKEPPSYGATGSAGGGRGRVRPPGSARIPDSGRSASRMRTGIVGVQRMSTVTTTGSSTAQRMAKMLADTSCSPPAPRRVVGVRSLSSTLGQRAAHSGQNRLRSFRQVKPIAKYQKKKMFPVCIKC